MRMTRSLKPDGLPYEGFLLLGVQTLFLKGELVNESFNELRPTKIGKANLHTWLAWKRDPGKPFGQAINAGYFNLNASSIKLFLDWFYAVFKLSTQ